MSLFSKFFSQNDPKDKLIPLYQQIVEHGRQPSWYLQGGVKDTQDGRFDMIVAILVIILLRLESEQDLTQDTVYLTEIFVDDMDGQLRELGMGDVVVGKHIGNMVGALGGRLKAYRVAYITGDLDGALTRNLYRNEAPKDIELQFVRDNLVQIYNLVQKIDARKLITGHMAW